MIKTLKKFFSRQKIKKKDIYIADVDILYPSLDAARAANPNARLISSENINVQLLDLTNKLVLEQLDISEEKLYGENKIHLNMIVDIAKNSNRFDAIRLYEDKSKKSTVILELRP